MLADGPARADCQEEGTLRAITYEAPKSLAQALSLLAAAGEKGRVLAGGTDLLIQMRAGVRQPDLVIDAKAEIGRAHV